MQHRRPVFALGDHFQRGRVEPDVTGQAGHGILIARIGDGVRPFTFSELRVELCLCGLMLPLIELLRGLRSGFLDGVFRQGGTESGQVIAEVFGGRWLVALCVLRGLLLAVSGQLSLQ